MRKKEINIRMCTVDNAAQYGEIIALAVTPAYRKRGIATKLLEKCMADVKERGMTRVNLITASESILPAFYESGKIIYEKQGFK